MTILFDLDGTLLDTGPDFLITLNQMLTQDSLPTIPYAAIRPYINLGTSKMLEIAYGQTATEAMRKRFLAIYLELNLANTKLFPGVMQMLVQLHANYRLGLVTNKSTKLTLLALHKFAIHKFFSAIVCGDTLAVKKPDPAPLLLAAQQLRVAPEKCIFIGDAQTDIIAGKSAKMRTILATFGYVPQDSNTLASWHADSLSNNTQQLLETITLWS